MERECPNCQFSFDPTQAESRPGFCPHCAGPMAGEFSGARFGEFTVLAEIGRGNNGIVFLARQNILNRIVALKVMRPEQLADHEVLSGFLRESKVTAQLNHPNIIQAWAAGLTINGYGFFAMELVDGYALDVYLYDFGAPSFGEALKIGSKIAGALAYTWETKKMTHGDIKPANIIVRTADGEPKLADLGLAQFADEPRSREIMATPLYAPPEVINFQFNSIGPASDVYSFGATLYELFSGEPPFPGEDMNQVLEQQRYAKPVPLKDCGWFDSSLSDFIDQMLDKDPDLRPSWLQVADFLQTLAVQRAL